MATSKSDIERDSAVMADLLNAVEVANEVAPAVGGRRRRGGVAKRKLAAAEEEYASYSAPAAPVVPDAPALPQTKQEVAKIKEYLTKTIPEEVDGFLAKVLRKAPSIALAVASGAVFKKAALTPGMFSGLTEVIGNVIAAIPSPTWQEVGESYSSMISSIAGVSGDVATWLQSPAGVLFITAMVMRHRAASNNMSVFEQLKSDASKVSGMATERVKEASVKAVEAVKKEVETGKNVFATERKRRGSVSAASALSAIPGVEGVRKEKEAAAAMLDLAGPTGGRRRKTKKVKKSKRRVTRRKLFAY